MNRRNFTFIAFVLLLLGIFITLTPCKGAASETLPAKPDSADWFQVFTENAGVLPLPAGWSVVSKDDVTERSAESELVLNVQQVLHAKTEDPAAGESSVLQVFSVWETDWSGKILPLPDRVLQETEGEFLASLMGVRYGNVKILNTGMLDAEWQDVPVTTCQADLSKGDGIHYKCASLFNGEKLILVLVKYLPKYEEYWNGQFASLINKWVTSTALTVFPLPDSTLELPPLENLPHIVSAPQNILPQNILPRPEGASENIQSGDEKNVPPGPELTSEREPSLFSPFIFYGAAVAFGLFFVVKAIFIRQKKPSETPPPDSEDEEIFSTPEELPSENLAELLVEDDSGLLDEEGGCMEDTEEERPELLCNSVSTQDSASGEVGFERVYTLLNQALSNIETLDATPAVPEARRKKQTAEIPLKHLRDVFKSLEVPFGSSYILDTVEDEVLKVLENGEGTPLILQTEKDRKGAENIASDCFILKSSRNAVINLLQTGRYHIGKGILSNEGQELENLFYRINDKLRQDGHSTPEEAKKDADLIQRRIRNLG